MFVSIEVHRVYVSSKELSVCLLVLRFIEDM